MSLLIKFYFICNCLLLTLSVLSAHKNGEVLEKENLDIYNDPDFKFIGGHTGLLLRPKKSNLASICVEIKPASPYEEPYFMCKENDYATGGMAALGGHNSGNQYEEGPKVPTRTYKPKSGTLANMGGNSYHRPNSQDAVYSQPEALNMNYNNKHGYGDQNNNEIPNYSKFQGYGSGRPSSDIQTYSSGRPEFSYGSYGDIVYHHKQGSQHHSKPQSYSNDGKLVPAVEYNSHSPWGPHNHQKEKYNDPKEQSYEYDNGHQTPYSSDNSRPKYGNQQSAQTNHEGNAYNYGNVKPAFPHTEHAESPITKVYTNEFDYENQEYDENVPVDVHTYNQINIGKHNKNKGIYDGQTHKPGSSFTSTSHSSHNRPELNYGHSNTHYPQSSTIPSKYHSKPAYSSYNHKENESKYTESSPQTGYTGVPLSSAYRMFTYNEGAAFSSALPQPHLLYSAYAGTNEPPQYALHSAVKSPAQFTYMPQVPAVLQANPITSQLLTYSSPVPQIPCTSNYFFNCQLNVTPVGCTLPGPLVLGSSTTHHTPTSYTYNTPVHESLPSASTSTPISNLPLYRPPSYQHQDSYRQFGSFSSDTTHHVQQQANQGNKTDSIVGSTKQNNNSSSNSINTDEEDREDVHEGSETKDQKKGDHVKKIDGDQRSSKNADALMRMAQMAQMFAKNTETKVTRAALPTIEPASEASSNEKPNVPLSFYSSVKKL